jgi:hypothetical protein
VYGSRMKRVSISRGDFEALRAGDLIVWRGKYLRTVAKGPGDADERPRHLCVEFPIRRRTWRKRIETLYNYNDVKDKIAVAHKRTAGLMLPSEWKVLEGAGFDVRLELQRELADQTASAERMGHPLCKAHPRLSKLIGRLKPDRSGSKG